MCLRGPAAQHLHNEARRAEFIMGLHLRLPIFLSLVYCRVMLPCLKNLRGKQPWYLCWRHILTRSESPIIIQKMHPDIWIEPLWVGDDTALCALKRILYYVYFNWRIHSIVFSNTMLFHHKCRWVRSCIEMNELVFLRWNISWVPRKNCHLRKESLKLPIQP